MGRGSKWFCWLLAALTGGVSPTALAETAEVEGLLARGVELRKAGRDVDALPLFRKAAEQQPTPRTLAQLGTCEQAAGLWVDAEAHLNEALKRRDDPWIRKHDVPLRQALGHVQDKLGSVDVWGSPDGARIKIDGQLVGTLPTGLAFRVAEGQRTITVDAVGFVPQKRTLQVVSGSLVREHFVLEPLASPTALTPATAAMQPPAAAQSPLIASGTMGGQEATESATTPIYVRWWFWAIVGTAAAAAGTTAYLLLKQDGNCQALQGGTCVKL